MSTVSSNELNSKLWNAARDGNNDAVLAAISAGGYVNWNNDSHGGWTPLHIACVNGHESTVLVLLQNGADHKLQNEDGDTPLYIACFKGHASIVLVLLQNEADPNLKIKGGWTPLYKACVRGHESTVRVLLQYGADPKLQNEEGFTPLYIACFKGHASIVLVLLQNEADPNLQDKDGYTPLHIACENGHESTVQVLLQNGADPNRQDETGDTPLHCAIFFRHQNVVKILLSKGADRNISNNGGVTPIAMHVDLLKEEQKISAINDNAKGGSDRLGFKAYAKAIYTVVNQAKPSLCVGINAEWGCGKSFLIEQIKKEFDPTLQLRISNSELVQWYEDGFNDSEKCKPLQQNDQEILGGKQPDTAMKIRFDLFRKYCVDPLYPTLLKIFSDFLKIYTFATIIVLVCDDIKLLLIYFQFIYDVLYECIRLKKRRRSKWFNFFSDEENQLFKSNSIEYIIIQFDSWLFKLSDELWTALIRELYKKVELRLSKHNSEEYFTSHPNELRANSKDYLSKWRTRKAAALLVEKYGGMNHLRVRLYGFIAFVFGALVTSVLSGLGYINIWTQVIHEARQIWILVMSVVGVILAIIPLLLFLYNTNQNAETSRGDAIYEEAKDLKDKIGFMGRVRQELDDLFGFMRSYKDETRIELRLLIFVDDLDRCIEEGRNVKFLEAIQLMLKISGAPIVVFLAIDSRIVVASIEATVSKSLNLQQCFITGYEYLEKIIQLSFCLPPPSSQMIKSYIDYCVRSPEVDINYVVRKINALLTAMKDMNKLYPKANYFLECSETSPFYSGQKNKISYDDIKSIIDKKDTAAVTLLKDIAKVLNQSTKQAVAKFENIGYACLDDLLHSLLSAISTVAIIYIPEDNVSEMIQVSSDKQTTKIDILRFLASKQWVKSNFDLEMTKTLQKINNEDVDTREKMENILSMCSSTINRSPNVLLPKDIVDLVESIAVLGNVNARSVKRTLNELMIIFQVANFKAIDEADPGKTIIYFEEWTELSKKLAVWILLCTMFPYRISFLIHRIHDFIQKQSLNSKSSNDNDKKSDDNDQSQLISNSSLLYGSNEDDCTIPDIENIPISMIYAEHVEPYIYTIKSAERLLRLDGDPDDFILILDRMTYDKNDENKLPSILCGDILGKLVAHDTDEYILNGYSMNEKNSTERLKHASTERDDDVTKEHEMGDKSNDDVGARGCHYDVATMAENDDGEKSVAAVTLQPMIYNSNEKHTFFDNNCDNHVAHEDNNNHDNAPNNGDDEQRYTCLSSEKDDGIAKEDGMNVKSNVNIVEKEDSDVSKVDLESNENDLVIGKPSTTATPFRLEKRKQPFRLECLALITYSLNLNPSIRKQISMEMSSLTTDRELHIRSTRPSVDKKTTSRSHILQQSQNITNISTIPSTIDAEVVMKMINQSTMINQSLIKMFNLPGTVPFDPTTLEEESIITTQEITSTEQRMEATFTNVLSSRKKIQLKKDVVMEGCTYNILKKNH